MISCWHNKVPLNTFFPTICQTAHRLTTARSTQGVKWQRWAQLKRDQFQYKLQTFKMATLKYIRVRDFFNTCWYFPRRQRIAFWSTFIKTIFWFLTFLGSRVTLNGLFDMTLDPEFARNQKIVLINVDQDAIVFLQVNYQHMLKNSLTLLYNYPHLIY